MSFLPLLYAAEAKLICIFLLLEEGNGDLRCVKFVLLRQGYELIDFLQY